MSFLLFLPDPKSGSFGFIKVEPEFEPYLIPTRPYWTRFLSLRENTTQLNPNFGSKIGFNSKKRVGFGRTSFKAFKIIIDQILIPVQVNRHSFVFQPFYIVADFVAKYILRYIFFFFWVNSLGNSWLKRQKLHKRKFHLLHKLRSLVKVFFFLFVCCSTLW